MNKKKSKLKLNISNLISNIALCIHNYGFGGNGGDIIK